MLRFLLPVLTICLMVAKPEASPLTKSKIVSTLDGRIVGGVEASIEQFPHQVSLQQNGKHICGAIVIYENVLLTAAHCVDKQKSEIFSVRVGSSETAQGGFLYPIQRIITHEEYNQPTPLNNDIALLFLEHPLSFNKSIRPIPLMTEHDVILPGAMFFVSGWGAMSVNLPQVTSRLRFTAVEKIEHTKCTAAYRGVTKVTSMMICAGVPSGGRDSCQGDSGGPLITNVNGTMKLIGIVSWGISCAHASYPGVYTSVVEYNSWIQEKINDIELK